jgi:hypothetical protein
MLIQDRFQSLGIRLRIEDALQDSFFLLSLVFPSRYILTWSCIYSQQKMINLLIT